MQQVMCEFMPRDEPEPDTAESCAEGDDRLVAAEEVHPRCDHRRALDFNVEVGAQSLEIIPCERALIPSNA